jgi:tight adherence protein B
MRGAQPLAVAMPTEAIIPLALALLLSIGLGVRWYCMRRDRDMIARRLSSIINREPVATSHAQNRSFSRLHPDEPMARRHQPAATLLERQVERTEAVIAQSGFRYRSWDLYAGCGSLFLTCVLCSLICSLDFLWGAALGLLLAACPFIVITARARKRRRKFTEQLPNALDLFVSVLRSGHSIPQAVRAVADEVPAPCGSEFGEMLQRMNLGQTLPQALMHSVTRFQSFELDLIRRATEIQMEVGGSLAELLEKTNQTLRQRLKLQKQVQVLTAPSRLSAVIIFILPFLIAGTFSFINPHYMAPLTDTKIGRALLCMAVAAQLVGYLIMRKLASFKV